MKPVLRMQVLALCLVTMCNIVSAAGPLPTQLFTKKAFSPSVLNHFDTAYNKVEKASAKMCACQILNVSSKNQRNLRIAVLVEKTPQASSDLSQMKQLIDKEKKYMKYFFYEEMKTLNTVVAQTDCQTLYKKMQMATAELQLYQVLDGDVKRAIAIR